MTLMKVVKINQIKIKKRTHMNQSTAIEKNPQSEVLIRFSDCDPMGHLNNARYLDYFINSREDHLREFYGIDIYKHSMGSGVGWVVSQNQIAYLKPANLMETVIVQSQVIDHDKSSILVELFMWNKDKSEMKSVLWSKFVAIEFKSGKRGSIPEDLLLLLQDVKTNGVEISRGFDNRIMQLTKR